MKTPIIATAAAIISLAIGTAAGYAIENNSQIVDLDYELAKQYIVEASNIDMPLEAENVDYESGSEDIAKDQSETTGESSEADIDKQSDVPALDYSGGELYINYDFTRDWTVLGMKIPDISFETVSSITGIEYLASDYKQGEYNGLQIRLDDREGQNQIEICQMSEDGSMGMDRIYWRTADTVPTVTISSKLDFSPYVNLPCVIPDFDICNSVFHFTDIQNAVPYEETDYGNVYKCKSNYGDVTMTIYYADGRPHTYRIGISGLGTVAMNVYNVGNETLSYIVPK